MCEGLGVGFLVDSLVSSELGLKPFITGFQVMCEGLGVGFLVACLWGASCCYHLGFLRDVCAKDLGVGFFVNSLVGYEVRPIIMGI